jgi:hypothetical protein
VLTLSPGSVVVREGDDVSIGVSWPTRLPRTVTLAASCDCPARDGRQLLALLSADVIMPAGLTNATMRLRAPADFFDAGDRVACSVVLSSSDSLLASPSTVLPVIVVDDDVAGIVTSLASSRLSEGARTTASVFLRSQPLGDVTVSASVRCVAAAGDTVAVTSPSVSLTPASGVIAAANWTSPLSLNVSVMSDSVATGRAVTLCTVAIDSASSDGAYVNSSTLALSVLEDDVAGMLVAPEYVLVAEDPANNVSRTSVRLRSSPTADVTVTLNFDRAQVLVLPDVLVFNDSNWAVPQTVLVTALNDGVAEAVTQATSVALLVTSSDAQYSGVIGNVAVAVLDFRPEVVIDRTPAPILVSAVVSDTSDELVLTFDRDSDLAGMSVANASGAVSCVDADVLDDASQDQLHGTVTGAPPARCFWRSRSQFVALPQPTSLLLQPAGSASSRRVALRGGRVRSTATSVLAADGSVDVRMRTPPPVLTAAVFGDSGATVTLSFSSSSSMRLGNSSLSSGPCSLVLTNTNLGRGEWSLSATV